MATLQSDDQTVPEAQLQQKALADIAKLPVAQHQTKLVQIATKLDLDLP